MYEPQTLEKELGDDHLATTARKESILPRHLQKKVCFYVVLDLKVVEAGTVSGSDR
jgi:hypothetical protein